MQAGLEVEEKFSNYINDNFSGITSQKLTLNQDFLKQVVRGQGISMVATGGMAGLVKLAEALYPPNFFDFNIFIPGMLAVSEGCVVYSLVEFQKRLLRQRVGLDEKKLEASNYLLSSHPDWQDSLPSLDMLDQSFQSVLYLPPVGGKIVPPTRKTEFHQLKPSFLAETQVDRVRLQVEKLKSKGKITGAYIHHMGVQGRLPDEFKYVAIGLILGSPYKYDWDTSAFDAPWGKVAPLIHDGGFTNTRFNPVWAGIEGRTDFIQRVVSTGNDVADEMERNRLLADERAYQYHALALHAKLRNTPFIPEDRREALVEYWEVYKKRMQLLLREFDTGLELQYTLDTPWFYNNPRFLWEYFPPRHEAEWDPIKSTLKRLEERRWEYPQLCLEAVNLLEQSSAKIGRIIGLA